ncbi:MAG: FAD-dependent oxidoreductase [Bacteroidetes bacterium]|nr:FAD-dependent oxidoreductase [Bacteroidota bacterium]
MQSDSDVIIVGAGIAGISCALTLAENNIGVTLIEQNNFVGGNATGGLCCSWRGFTSKEIKNKLLNEFVNKSIEKNISQGIVNDLTGTSPYMFSFNPDGMKDILFDILSSQKIKLKLNSKLVDVEINRKTIKSIKTIAEDGENIYSAKIFVDATGNSSIARESGVKKINSSQTVIYKIRVSGVNKKILLSHLKINPIDSNIDINKMDAAILNFTGFAESLRKWFSEYKDLLRLDGIEINEIPFSEEFIISMFAFEYSTENISSLSNSILASNKIISNAILFLRTQIPGFSNCYLSSNTDNLSFVNSEQIITKEVLTDADILLGKKFDNAIAETLIPTQNNLVFNVSKNSMFVEEIDNLLIIGRSILPRFAFYKNGNQLLTSKIGAAAANYIFKNILN